MKYVCIINLEDNFHKRNIPKLIQKSYKELFEKISHAVGDLYVNFLQHFDSDSVQVCLDKILLGKAYFRNSNKRISKEYLSSKLISTNDIYGKYILIEKKEGKVYVWRDPIGQLGCYYEKLNENQYIIASEIYLIKALILKKLTLNYTYFANFIVRGQRYNSHTPFKGIRELLPGMVLSIDKLSRKTTIKNWWRINQITLPNRIAYEKQLIEGMEQNIIHILDNTQNILLQYSGGTDSTALLYAFHGLSSDRERIKTINLWHPSIKSSNELTVAHNITKKLGIELIDFNLENALPFTPHKTIVHPPSKPVYALSQLLLNQKVAEIAVSMNATQVSGHGGDHLFCVPPPKTLLADYIKHFGFKNMTEVLHELAVYFREPYFKILMDNLSHTILRKFLTAKKSINFPVWFKDDFKNMILEQDSFKLDLRSLKNPSKHERGTYLEQLLGDIYTDAINQNNPIIYPLVHERIIDIALSIPGYYLLKNRFNRYYYRHAISKRYRTDNMWRYDKGETTGVLQLGLKKNRDYIADLMKKGIFYKERLIDIDSFLNHLTLFTEGSTTANTRFLINVICAEIFTSTWQCNFN